MLVFQVTDSTPPPNLMFQVRITGLKADRDDKPETLQTRRREDHEEACKFSFWGQ